MTSAFSADVGKAKRALAKLPCEWDGKKCVLELKEADYNWKQMLMRPAIEIPLIIGTWFDDRANVDIWKQRVTNLKAYKQCYGGGKLMHLQSLPDSVKIQRALSRINDLFLHPNPDYCYRHFVHYSLPPRG